MSRGSVLPDRGFRPAPLGAASRVLQQDRTELDQAQRALAPGDDGVHAGAVDVVSADPAVAITIEGCGVATVPAISLTRDEIDEGLFFCLLHYSPQCDGNHPLGRAAAGVTEPGRDGRWPEYTVSIRCSQEVSLGSARVNREMRRKSRWFPVAFRRPSGYGVGAVAGRGEALGRPAGSAAESPPKSASALTKMYSPRPPSS